MCVPAPARPRTQIRAECRRGTEGGGGQSDKVIKKLKLKLTLEDGEKTAATEERTFNKDHS